MMNWLWIPAVALLGLFILVLCWLFFADYTCCPCKRRRRLEPVLPTENRHIITPSAPLPPILPRYPVLPTAPQYFPVAPRDTPNLHLKFADIPLNEVIRFENGILTLDLHKMTVKEATDATNDFIKRNRGFQEKVKIVTGRGLHSDGGVAKVKPAIQALLIQQNLPHTEIHQGGCYEVLLAR